MNRIALGLSILAIVPALIHAQDSPVGKYTGSYETSGIANVTHSVTVEIASVEDGKVKATAMRNSTARTPGCRGQYTLEGTYKDNKLSLRETEKGGSAGDCAFRFTGTREGDAFVGKFGQTDLTLRK